MLYFQPTYKGVINDLTQQLDEQMSEVSCIRTELYQSNKSRDRLAYENDAFVEQVKNLNSQIAVFRTQEYKDSDIFDQDQFDDHFSSVLQLQTTVNIRMDRF